MMNNLFNLFKSDVGIAQALGYSALGFAIVFLMLIVLLAVIKVMVAGMNRKSRSAPLETEEPAEKPAPSLAPGSAGRIKLFDVPDVTAAMLMAIVADKMQKPLNELRFLSIKEVK